MVIKEKLKLSKAFKNSISKIIEAGGFYIKVELEAQFDRGSIDKDCENCNDGWLSCDNCENKGYVSVESSLKNIFELECRPCEGHGETECSQCNGRGQIRSGMQCSEIENWLEQRFSPEFKQALVYGEVYDDGSVDTEYTFTLPTDKCHLTLEAIHLFNEFGRYIGNDLDINNAGMHISVLPEPTYPCSISFNEIKMRNFRTEVTKLLPALYFLATPNETTRALTYREPYVSDEEKYSAIFTHGDTAIEYRIFDTCYQEPEKFLENIEVIAHTLKYYSNEKVNVSYKNFQLFHGLAYVDGLKKLYTNLTNYEALRQTLPLIKPAKTIKKLKQERQLSITKSEIVTDLNRNKKNFQNSYKDYTKRITEENKEHIRLLIGQIIDIYKSSGETAFSLTRRTILTNNGTTKISLDPAILENLIKTNPEVFRLTKIVTLTEYVANSLVPYQIYKTLTI